MTTLGLPPAAHKPSIEEETGTMITVARKARRRRFYGVVVVVTAASSYTRRISH